MAKSRYFRKRILGSFFLMLTMLLFLFGYGPDVYGRPGMPNIDPLFTKASIHGFVRIIVGFDVGFQPEGNLSAALVQTQRDLIAMAQDEVLYRLASHNVTDVKRFQYIPYMAMEVDGAALAEVQQIPTVTSIQEDVPGRPTLAQSVPLINADDVWAAGFTGSGQAVAVLDTGVDKTHGFLDAGKVVSEACYSTTSAANSSTSVCPGGVSESTSPGSGMNCDTTIYGCDHGTHVAGIAAGTGGTGGLEGVAKAANVIAIQVFSRFDGDPCTDIGLPTPCAFTYTSDQIKGLERVYALRTTYNIAAVNMSLGGGRYTSNCDTDSRKAIIDNLRSVGIATVIASGNDYYTDALGAPACISTAVSVGATNKSDVVANFSNSASFLHLLAPGVSINSSIPGNSYDSKGGTSMAAPHVAGAFALLKEAEPSASVTGILSALQSTGVPITDGRNGITKPRIDVKAALDDLQGVCCPKPSLTVDLATYGSERPIYNWPCGNGEWEWFYVYVQNLSTGKLYSSGWQQSSASSWTQQPYPLPWGNYRAWVQVYHPQCGFSEWSDPQDFTVGNICGKPTLQAPTGNPPVYTWSCGTGQWTWFWVYVTNLSTNAYYGSNWVNSSANTWTSANTLPAGNYRAWVQVYGGGVVSEWSDPVNFTVSGGGNASVRFFNNLTCSGTTFTATFTICGQALSSNSGVWSTCKTLTPATCSWTLYANAGNCGIIQASGSYTVAGGKVYNFVLTLSGVNIIVGVYVQDGNCSTAPPWWSFDATDTTFEVLQEFPNTGFTQAQ